MLALAGVGLALYAPVFGLLPFEEDNVYVLAWSAGTPAARVVAVDPPDYPQWRPLSYATVWIEDHLGAPIWAHFAVNLALWITCSCLVFLIVMRLTQSPVGALFASVMVLTDPRATWTLVAIDERQTSFACAFGLLAVWLAVRAGSLSTMRQAGIGALLVASMLSKEYGASFAIALVVYGWVQGRRDRWLAAAVAVSAYYLLRTVVVGASVQPYCEDMYFFGTAQDVCLTVSDPDSWPQMAYNATATLVNLPLLGLLSDVGRPIFAESRLVAGLVFSALALAAIARGPRETRLLVLIAVANAALSLLIYRERNQLAGACALAILSGIGLRPALKWWSRRVWRIALIAALAALIATQAVLARALVVERGAIAAQIEPCELDIMERPFVPSYVAALKAAYNLPDPECRTHRR